MRQGYFLSPIIFKIHFVLLKWSQQGKYMRVWIGAEFIYTLLFADGQVVFAQDEDDASYTKRDLNDAFKHCGLEINLQKIHYLMVVGEQGHI